MGGGGGGDASSWDAGWRKAPRFGPFRAGSAEDGRPRPMLGVGGWWSPLVLVLGQGRHEGGQLALNPGTVARECRLPFSCFSCLGLVALFVLCALVPYVCDGRFSKLVIMGIGDWSGFFPVRGVSNRVRDGALRYEALT